MKLGERFKNGVGIAGLMITGLMITAYTYQLTVCTDQAHPGATSFEQTRLYVPRRLVLGYHYFGPLSKQVVDFFTTEKEAKDEASLIIRNLSVPRGLRDISKYTLPERMIECLYRQGKKYEEASRKKEEIERGKLERLVNKLNFHRM